MRKIDAKELERWANSEEGQKAITESLTKALEAINSMCDRDEHSDELYCYSGADIYWRCRRCGRTHKQEGGNLPMTI